MYRFLKVNSCGCEDRKVLAMMLGGKVVAVVPEMVGEKSQVV